MKCLSFNCMGLASPDKKLVLGMLLGSNRIDVLLLQETLGNGVSINNIMLNMLPDWNFHTIDVRGRSEGCSLGFNKKTIKLDNFLGGNNIWVLISKPLILIHP